MTTWIIKLFASKYIAKLVKLLDGNKTATGIVLVLLTTLQHYYPDHSLIQVVQIILAAIPHDATTLGPLTLLVVGILDKIRKLYFAVQTPPEDKKIKL